MDTLKLLIAPGSLALLTVALIAGAIVRWRATGSLARAARVWMAAWAIAYLLISLPVVARPLTESLTTASSPILAAEEVRGATAVVVLGGGAGWHRFGERDVAVMSSATSFRVAEAARVYHLLDGPMVIVSGRSGAAGDDPEIEAMREGLVAAGVSPDRLVIDAASTSTRGSAVNIAALLRARSIGRPVMVTSANHVRRAVLAFRAEGVEVLPSPAPPGARERDRPRPRIGIRSFVPAVGALSRSEEALHEYAGLLYYWARGWT